MRFEMPTDPNLNNMEKTSEEPKEIETGEVVDDEEIKLPELPEFSEEEKRKAEQENLSKDDINEMKIEAAKKELKFSNDTMEFQEIENLISEGELDKAKKEIELIKNKLNGMMGDYNKPGFRETVEGARLLLHTEVLNLYRHFPKETNIDQVKSKRLEAETLYDSARFQEDSEWKNKDGIITDCELALKCFEDIDEIKKEDIEAKQEYQKWGRTEMIKSELNRMLEEAKGEVEKEQE